MTNNFLGNLRRIWRQRNALPAALLLAGLLGPPSAASPAQANPALPERATLAAALQQGGARISYHAETGQVRFIGTEPGRPLRLPGALPAGATPTDAGRQFLSAYGTLFGLADPARELAVVRERAEDRGRSTVRFQQVHKGVPVFGGELLLLLDGAGNLISATGEALPDLALDTTPAIDADTARQTAVEAAAKWHGAQAAWQASEPALWIYNPILVGPGLPEARLVWRTEVSAPEAAHVRELVLIDARRGSIALHFNQVDQALNRQTYTANNTTTLPGTLKCNESNPTCAGGDSHAVAAHKYAGHTYNFYMTHHGRDSINGAGMTLVSTVHYGSSYANAFWNGAQMVYGDGYGFPLADDVVAHELTHGVTQYESNLFYYYQSGAINESFSDIWGEFVDLTNGEGTDTAGVRWKLGEDISGLGALRDMKDPTVFGDPDKMTSPHYWTGPGDNGGVHINSGISNKAAYLMTDGGDFNGQTVTALGIAKTATIYYEAQTRLLVSGSDYADLYDALYQGCLNLTGTAGITNADCQEVRDATDAVEMKLQPIAGFNTDAPLCADGQLPLYRFQDDLENGAGNWGANASPGTSRWRYGSPYGRYAHSGDWFLYGDDYPAAVTVANVFLTVNVPLPAGQTAYLWFAHAYGFEAPDWDGGVLQYSTNGGSSWTNVPGGWFTHNGYDGTISTSWDNPLAGQQAFLADSHGYISTRVDLTSLAGQNVRFRWRMALDSLIYNWGWWLDDVRVYNCFTPTSNIYLPLAVRQP